MSYQLRTDTLGRNRLNLQGQLYNPGSQKFLLSQGVKKEQSILEIGCGSGSMTTWLAEQVGKQGRVLAIDNSRPQVRATERLVKKFKLRQVQCLELSLFDLDQLQEKFDIIYLRCVLIHLKEPNDALAKIIPRLKKNGKLIIEEIINSCNFSLPESEAFKKRRFIIEQFFIRNGLNPNFGLTLKTILQKNKFKDIQESLFQPILKSNTERKLLSLILHEAKEKFISLEILSLSEWDKLLAELEAMQNDKNCFVALSSLYQICAQL